MTRMEIRSKDSGQMRSVGKIPIGDLRDIYRSQYPYRARKEPPDSFDVERYLEERKALIDAALETYIGRSRQIPRRLHEAICYGVLGGGKRFRPILTLAVGELFAAKRWALLPFATAIELIHCYSLIHDDLPMLDDDDLRRGKPSCHKRFGEAMALLAGDALLTESFFIMSDTKLARFLGAQRVAMLFREISD